MCFNSGRKNSDEDYYKDRRGFSNELKVKQLQSRNYRNGIIKKENFNKKRQNYYYQENSRNREEFQSKNNKLLV